MATRATGVRFRRVWVVVKERGVRSLMRGSSGEAVGRRMQLERWSSKTALGFLFRVGLGFVTRVWLRCWQGYFRVLDGRLG